MGFQKANIEFQGGGASAIGEGGGVQTRKKFALRQIRIFWFGTGSLNVLALICCSCCSYVLETVKKKSPYVDAVGFRSIEQYK